MTHQAPNFKRVFYQSIVDRLSSFVPLIQIIVGPRQVGKTTAIRSFLKDIPDKGTYISLDNPGPSPHELIRFEWEKVVNKSGHKVIVFDEIQNVTNWGSLIKELYDEERPKRELSVAILGSSSLDLLLNGEESLLGRFEVIKAPHWSFFEMRSMYGWDLNSFLKFGGYPIIGDLLNETEESYERCGNFVRDAVIEPVITRDIFSLKNVLNTGLFRQVLKIVLSLPCRQISFAKLVGQLNDKGSSATIKGYLELLEKAFLIRLLYGYSGGVIRKRTSSPKIIPLAPALIHAFKDPLQIDDNASWFGDVFEAAVIARICETNFDLYYWSNSRQDVDVVIEGNGILCAVEIKSNQEIDFKGLNAFRIEYPTAKILMIDRGRGEELLLSEDPKKLILSWIK
jgi:predicted AAA+ superfamily ATPase